jgi:hypothetical protein
MKTTLDGQSLFDELGLRMEIASPSRACVERAVCGLDGTVSIDLGKRSRQIRQIGILRASNRSSLSDRADAITVFIDGGTHTLGTADGRRYDGVRMDSFRRISERVDGAGMVLEYEILYTQLGA